MWGATDLNKDNVPAWNVTYKGDVVFDAKFSDNFHTVESQLFQMDACSPIYDPAAPEPINFDEATEDE
jgi:hypothetical protein